MFITNIINVAIFTLVIILKAKQKKLDNVILYIRTNMKIKILILKIIKKNMLKKMEAQSKK